MVNNSTNINKANNDLSLEPTEYKIDHIFDLGNLSPGLEQAHCERGIIRLIGLVSPSS